MVQKEQGRECPVPSAMVTSCPIMKDLQRYSERSDLNLCMQAGRRTPYSLLPSSTLRIVFERSFMSSGFMMNLLMPIFLAISSVMCSL